MDDRLVWTIGATSDLQEIYSKLSELRANRLLEKLDAALSTLKIFPELAPVYLLHQRRLVIGNDRRYGVFYAIEGRRIVISAVADLRQSPQAIKKQLRSRLP